MRTGMLVFLGLFLFALARCKSPESEIEEANITVSDECGVTVDIFMDGEFQFSLEYLSTDIIASVALGVHEFEAKKEGTEDLVTTETYDIHAGGELIWTIQSPAIVKVTNACGQTVSLYANGDYKNDLEDQESITFENVCYGVYQLDAVRTIDNSLVDSITINVVENKEYIWLISS